MPEVNRISRRRTDAATLVFAAPHFMLDAIPAGKQLTH